MKLVGSWHYNCWVLGVGFVENYGTSDDWGVGRVKFLNTS